MKRFQRQQIALRYKFSQKLLTRLEKNGMLNPKTKERGRAKSLPLSTRAPDFEPYCYDLLRN